MTFSSFYGIVEGYQTGLYLTTCGGRTLDVFKKVSISGDEDILICQTKAVLSIIGRRATAKLPLTARSMAPTNAA